MQLTSLGTGAGFLKAGFLGFAGSGKTYTAKELAIGTRAHFHLDGPIAMLDSEGGAQYVAADVRKRTGKDMVGVQTRTLSDAVEFLQECLKIGVSVAILDSVTHLWREVCDSYLKQVNEQLVLKGRARRARLEFQDWGPIKDKWATFSNLFLNSKLHVIICGRAGFEWDFEERQDGSGKDLVKTGIKMKTEGEFGYEPSVLVQMEQVQTIEDGKHVSKIVRRATCLKDRFAAIDGKTGDNPGFDFFLPHVSLLQPGAAVVVDTTKQTPMNVDETGDAEWQRERRQRAILAEEIAGVLTVEMPGQSAVEKRAKALVLHRCFGTYSWEALQTTDSAKLRDGMKSMPDAIAAVRAEARAIEEAEAAEPKPEKKVAKAVKA